MKRWDVVRTLRDMEIVLDFTTEHLCGFGARHVFHVELTRKLQTLGSWRGKPCLIEVYKFPQCATENNAKSARLDKIH